MTQAWDWIFPLADDANDEPHRSDSIGGRARARGVSPKEEAYDRLLDDDGHAMLLVTLGNFENYSLDTVGESLHRDDVVLGLGDGGAHYGMICDASYPTYLLTHWVRDRAPGRFSPCRKPSVSSPQCRPGLRGWATAGESRSVTRPISTSSTTRRFGCISRDHLRPACRRASAKPTAEATWRRSSPAR